MQSVSRTVLVGLGGLLGACMVLAASAGPVAPVQGVIHFQGQLVVAPCSLSTEQLTDIAQDGQQQRSAYRAPCPGRANVAPAVTRVIQLANPDSRIVVIEHE